MKTKHLIAAFIRLSGLPTAPSRLHLVPNPTLHSSLAILAAIAIHLASGFVSTEAACETFGPGAALGLVSLGLCGAL